MSISPKHETTWYCWSCGGCGETLNSRGSFGSELRRRAELWLDGSCSTCTHRAWLPFTLSLSWEPKFSLLHIYPKEETLYRYSRIDRGRWLSGGEYNPGKAPRTATNPLCETVPWQTSTILILKSRHPPPDAYLPKKIMQLQGQFYHGLSSFPAELNKRWRVRKWFRHVLQWVSDSSGFRKNSGFFLAHSPIFQTQCLLLTIPCFHFIWFPLSKIRSIKFKLYCGLVKHSNTQRSLYWMQAVCWDSLSAKHRLTKAASLTVLSHATVEHFPCPQLAIQGFFHSWMWLIAQRLLDTGGLPWLYWM